MGVRSHSRRVNRKSIYYALVLVSFTTQAVATKGQTPFVCSVFNYAQRAIDLCFPAMGFTRKHKRYLRFL